jgi:preprotein translocase subunit Sec61beta
VIDENMAKKKSESSGLQSSAGLMRYFEADDTSIKLNPKMIVGACIGAGVVVMGLNIAFGLWPPK